MVTIRFYQPNPRDWLSMVCAYGGGILHNMNVSHVALEWDGGITEFTTGGLSHYTVEDELEFRPPDIILYIDKNREEINDMYQRAITFAQTGSKLTYRALLKKMLDLPLRTEDLLCTDYVQIVLGDEPQHLTPMEMLDQYFLSASQIIFSDYGRKVIRDGKISTAFFLPQLWEPRQSSDI